MQLEFLPQVLDRVAPDISLARHIAAGVRPCLRGFEEFKPLQSTQGVLNSDEGRPVVGSSIVRSGSTTVFCGISVGVVELDSAGDGKYASVYPVVEVARGRSGAPTDEEMILSQWLYESIMHSKLIPRESLKLEPGIAVNGDSPNSNSVLIYYPEINPEEYQLLNQRHLAYEVVLTAHIKVLSREGPLFDLCHKSLIDALHNVRIPRMYTNDTVDIRIPVRSRGNFGHLGSQQLLTIDKNPDVLYPIALNLQNIGLSSSFGVVDNSTLIAQLEGDAEETAVSSRMTVVASKDSLQGFSLAGPVDRTQIKRAIKLAQVRAELIDA